MVPHLQYLVINSGSTLSSSYASIKTGTFLGVFIPTVITSCVLYAHGSYDGTNFVRTLSNDGSGDWAAYIGAGSKAVPGTDALVAYSYLKLESSVALTATTTICLATKQFY